MRKVRKTAPASKVKTIHLGKECFRKKSLDLRLKKLKKSEYKAFINFIFLKRELLNEVMKFRPYK